MRLDPPGIEILRLYKTDPDGPDVLTLDCLLTSHPIVAEAWRSRTEVPFERGAVSVVSSRSMIALKRLRSSPQDLLDIETLQALEERRPEETGADA